MPKRTIIEKLELLRTRIDEMREELDAEIGAIFLETDHPYALYLPRPELHAFLDIQREAELLSDFWATSESCTIGKEGYE